MNRLLIADDDALILEMVCRYLELSGYQTIRASSGRKALELAAQERPDLIVMDLAMPDIDGYEATRQLKSNPLTQAIPVIVLTAFAFDRDYQKALKAGCDDFETKPVNFDQLLMKIRSLLRRYAPNE